MTLTSGHSKTS